MSRNGSDWILSISVYIPVRVVGSLPVGRKLKQLDQHTRRSSPDDISVHSKVVQANITIMRMVAALGIVVHTGRKRRNRENGHFGDLHTVWDVHPVGYSPDIWTHGIPAGGSDVIETAVNARFRRHESDLLSALPECRTF
jgi:hypothetical protein